MSATTEAVIAFHRQRRMFALVNDELHFAPAGDERDHKTWFDHSGWSRIFDDTVRGFMDPTGIYVYRGQYFFDPTFVDQDLAEHADLFDAPPETPVWAGMQKGAPGERWKPIRSLGTLGDLLKKRQTTTIELRLRPETVNLLLAAMGPHETAKLIRRAVGAGADDKVLRLFQSECRPHQSVKVRSGAQSSELFKCARCGATWWD